MLLVEIIIPLLSAQIKSAQVLDLILLRVRLMLITWEDKSLVNLLPRSLDIGTMTCLQEGPLVVILILGFSLSFELVMTFWMELIFLLERLGNVSLIFKVFIVILEESTLESRFAVEA